MTPFADGWTIDDINAAVERADPRELLHVSVVISLNPPDCRWSQALCVRLATHPDEEVRGNAVLAFGHLARTCGHLDEPTVKPILETALQDPSPYVRSQAQSAADDVEHFLHWRLTRPAEHRAQRPTEVTLSNLPLDYRTPEPKPPNTSLARLLAAEERFAAGRCSCSAD